jgi:hypothetical protein
MRVGLAILILVGAGCAFRGYAPPTYDLERVSAALEDECREPLVVDLLFCEEVVIAEIGGYEGTVQVPTTLLPAGAGRAQTVCEQLSMLNSNRGDGGLGFDTIVILDVDGRESAQCGAA